MKHLAAIFIVLTLCSPLISAKKPKMIVELYALDVSHSNAGYTFDARLGFLC
jgi:hypothetical protein